MSLEDLEKKMYRKEDRAKLDSERKHNTPYTVYTPKEEAKNIEFQAFQEKEISFFQRYKKQIFRGALGSLIVTVIIGALGGAYLLNQRRFAQSRVTLQIESVQEIDAGNQVSYTLKYTNDNYVSLRNARLSVTMPEALIDPSISILGQTRSEIREFDLPDIAPGESGEVTISGRIIAEKGTIHYMKGTLSYIPEIVSSTFTTSAEFATTVMETPLIIDIQTPLESASGNVVEYNIAINNRGGTDLSNLELRLEYPEGFGFTSSSVEPARDDAVFTIEKLKSQGVYEVKVTGTLSGETQDVKIVKAEVGESAQGVFTLYASGQNSTRMAAPYVALEQEIRGNPDKNVKSGDLLEYEVSIRNNTQVRIGEGILKVVLDSSLLDLSRLNAAGADFDASTNTLTWRANALAQLKSFAPNEEGQVVFSVPVKSVVPIENFEDVNYTIRTQAYFESSEIPTPLGVNKIVQGNTTEAKLATRLITKATAGYADSGTSIVNSGPSPLKVNQTTTLTLAWEIQNLTNDVNGVTFTSNLPENVSWTGQTTTGGVGELTYNERTKEIKWVVGDVPANTGILRPLYRAVFQIAVTPAPNQVGSEVALLGRTSFSGTDSFTDLNVGGTLSPLSTQDVVDPGFDGKVE